MWVATQHVVRPTFPFLLLVVKFVSIVFYCFLSFSPFPFFIIFTAIKAAVKMFLPLSVLSTSYLRDIFL